MRNDVDLNLSSTSNLYSVKKKAKKKNPTVNLEDGILSVLSAHLVAKWSESTANSMRSLANHSMESQLNCQCSNPSIYRVLFSLANNEGCLFDHASALWLFPNGSISAVIFDQEWSEI